MKPLALSSIGLFAFLLPVHMGLAASSSSAPATLYDRMKQGVEEELATDVVEPEIAEYVHTFLEDRGDIVSVEDVTAAMKHDSSALCGKRDPTDPSKSLVGCDDLAKRIRGLVMQEQRIRRLGRTLQRAATSYELPISDLPARSVQFSKDMRGIVSIWSTDDTDAPSGSTLKKPVPIRTKTIDIGVMSPLVQELGAALKDLKKEEQTAAVWRYQYGVRLVQEERAPDYPAPYEDAESGPDTERQYLFKNWTRVEAALHAIWDALKADTFVPPLKDKETALYIFPKDMLDDMLPDNIILWARMDGVPADLDPATYNYPLADAGLQWQLPVEPVLPSLLGENLLALPGGAYPPAPEVEYNDVMEPMDGRGLCSDPTAKKGFLCRPFSTTTEERCPDDPKNPVDPKKISLVTCDIDTSERTTISGADVCRDINYKTLPFDPKTQCTIEFKCAPDCTLPAGVTAATQFKNDKGVISICNAAVSTDLAEPYLLYHELHHAYQECLLPPDTDFYQKVPAGATPLQKKSIDELNSEMCCKSEGEAYRAQCDLMEKDGLFLSRPYTVDGIPFNAETCAEISTKNACGIRFPAKACFTSRTYSDAFKQEMIFEIKNNLTDAPKKCTDLFTVEKDGTKTFKDQRIQDLIDTIENRRPVCQPGQTDIFKNRIGNNMCYIGQCIEESLELHRLTPAQSPATIGDQSFPWNDPITGSPLGNALLNPPLLPALLPAYRPELVVEQLEQSLCQLQGLPPLTPSILCSYSAARRLRHPIIDPIANAQSILSDTQAQLTATNNTLALALGLGTRHGTEMYADYLRVASRSLADVLTMAVKLFKEMSSIDFPTNMCPMDNTLPPRTSSSSAGST